MQEKTPNQAFHRFPGNSKHVALEKVVGIYVLPPPPQKKNNNNNNNNNRKNYPVIIQVIDLYSCVGS